MYVPIRFSVWLVLLMEMLLGACGAKSNFVNLYKDPDYPSRPLDNVIVIAVERSQDLRRMWEQAIASELQSTGVLATPSYQLFPGSLPDSQQVVNVIRRDNMNGAIVTHRLFFETKEGNEGDYDRAATLASRDYWTGWYQSYYQAVALGAPAPDKAPKGSYQVDVWSARDGGRYVWTGSTAPFDPAKIEALVESVTAQLVPELERRDIIPKR
jgi:hypothetical protein